MTKSRTHAATLLRVGKKTELSTDRRTDWRLPEEAVEGGRDGRRGGSKDTNFRLSKMQDWGHEAQPGG